MNRHERRQHAKTHPVDHGPRLIELFQLHQRGHSRDAEIGYRQILAAMPDHPEAMRLLGEVLIDNGKADEAVLLLQRLVRLQPRQFIAHYSLGNAFRLGRKPAEAIKAYDACLKLNPSFAGAHHGLGAIYRGMERERQAADCFQLAVKCKPDWALAWKDLGAVLAILGDLPAARQAFSRALSLDPAMGEARRLLAAINGSVNVSKAPALQAPPNERIDILFALGREHDQAEKFDAAFGYFAEANALLRRAQAAAGRQYNAAKLSSDVDQLIAIFNPDVFTGAVGKGTSSEQPVFILGMPRSGSTLFEQIAASHSKVAGAGERKGIGVIANRLGWRPSARWTQDAIQAQGAEYLQAMRAAGGDARRIIDKMPDNIFQLGLIATLFPDARIIFCARDPRDTCLSCYFQHFSEPLGFDTDLNDAAHRFAETERLTAHWRAVLPLRTITLSYEALLGDLEGESRRLIDFLGLDWEPACLDFHQNQRPVRTASWAEVRQPLYHRSVGRWRAYAQHLGPVLTRFPE